MIAYHKAEEIQLVHSGSNYFEVLEQLINESKEIIHLQTYIFDSDKTGLRIIEALKNAAKRKVTIFVLADAFGSNSLSSTFIKELNSCGIHFRLFSPLFSSESVFFGRRLHHKIAVADKRVALVGGINIADKYYGINVETKAWLDYAILVRGSVCEYLHKLCEQFYERKKFSTTKEWERSVFQPHIGVDPMMVRFRRNDWIKGRNEIYKSYINAIADSKKSIVIVASYFLPGIRFRRLLKKAALRGVETKIILAGKSDIASVRFAESYLYEFYLRNKIQIYEWTNSVMHAKAMAVDNEWATIGSYNLNYLSHHVSIELNVDIADPHFVKSFTTHIDQIINNHCKKIILEETIKKNTWSIRWKMRLSYMFYKVLKAILVSKKKYKERKG